MSVILIVEDEILEQEFLKSVIEDEIKREDILLTCESGIQAITLANEYKPDIIIMDILIPELDGLSTIEEIRKFLPHTSIIILSASSDFHYAQKAITLKVLEYILKPVKPTVFKQVLRKVLLSEDKSEVISHEFIDKKINEHKRSRNSFVKESIQYIKEHFKEKLTLEMVSSTVFVNPKYFSHTFKKEMGISFSEYVINLRIQYACDLLEKTNYPAYRISIESGFSDASYFNRVFCAQMNMTPQAYRKYVHTSKQK